MSAAAKPAICLDSAALPISDKPAISLDPAIFRYRVMVGTGIVGQFSNLALASETAEQYGGRVVVWTGAGWSAPLE